MKFRFLWMIVMVAVFLSPLYGDRTYQKGIVTASKLNVRSGHNVYFQVLKTISQGTEVKVLDKKNGWYLIKVGSTEGWVSSRYIKIVSTVRDESSPSSGGKKKGLIAASYLSIRKGPSTGYSRVEVLKRDTLVEILAQKNGWYKIKFKGGVGWASAKYIRPVSSGPDEIKLPGGKKATSLSTFKVTYYWTIHEKDFSGPANTPVYDTKGRVIGRFPRSFAKHLRIEGSAILNDGRILNYVRNNRYQVVEPHRNAPYGLGSRNKPLQPYRSLAVDPDQIPLGTKIYIPEARGIRLPDGTVHDGIFYAHDVGGGIRGRRIDVFTGLGDNRKVFEKAGIKNLNYLTLYKVEDGDSIINRLRRSENSRTDDE